MKITVKKILALIVLMTVIDSFILIDYSWAESSTTTETTDEDKEKEAEKEKEKEELEEQQNKLEDKKEDAEKELQTIQSRLNQNQAALTTTQSLISKTEDDIKRKEAEIANLEKRIELNKKILLAYIQEMYYDDQDPVAGLLLSDQQVDEISVGFDQMVSVKEKVLSLIGEIHQTKDEVGSVKNELAEKVEDHEKLLAVQKGQNYEIKQDVQEAEATVSELNEKINKVRSELTQLLGSSVSFKNIMDAAKFASGVTGIRKDYLLGVLVVESNLGRYTGGCNFKESRMSGYRADVFKKVCKGLDYNYNKMKVSCPPAGYKGTGGAMGVAQFMPDTWMSYQNSIASVTGHDPPDPWDLTDGVVAMALKLTKVDGVKDHKKSAEAKAYCVYLAGGNWSAYCDNKGVNYGAKVLYWADNYEKMMD